MHLILPRFCPALNRNCVGLCPACPAFSRVTKKAAKAAFLNTPMTDLSGYFFERKHALLGMRIDR